MHQRRVWRQLRTKPPWKVSLRCYQQLRPCNMQSPLGWLPLPAAGVTLPHDAADDAAGIGHPACAAADAAWVRVSGVRPGSGLSMARGVAAAPGSVLGASGASTARPCRLGADPTGFPAEGFSV